MSELKPCPFYLGKEEIVLSNYYDGAYHENIARVVCEDCGASSRKFSECMPEEQVAELAIEAWNTRAERACNLKPWKPEFGMYDSMECECGCVMDSGDWAEANYCPSCKAKVVGD